MIAEAAYFRALSREFQGGDALDDWYGAEREIDQALLSVEAQGRSREKALVVRETPSIDAAKPGARQYVEEGPARPVRQGGRRLHKNTLINPISARPHAGRTPAARPRCRMPPC